MDKEKSDYQVVVEFSESLDNAIADIGGSLKIATASLAKITTAIAKFFTNPNDMAIKFASSLDKFLEYYKRIPDVIKHSMTVLAERGWFLNIDMTSSVVLKLESMVEEGKYEEVDDLLIYYFEINLEKIEAKLILNHPTRSALIKSAMNAHRRGEYELSIPVLLAQADGICMESVGYQLYSKDKKGNPKIAKYIDEIVTDKYKAAFLHPVTKDLPIDYSKKKRGSNFDDLNRHQVLHGESVDYGTKLNGYKAISLIYYISTALNMDLKSRNTELTD